jgi:hypothetical protein
MATHCGFMDATNWSPGSLVSMRALNRVLATGAGLGGLVLLLAGSVTARAGELAWGAAYIGEYNTNVARTPTGEVSDWIHSPLVGLAYRERSSTLTLDFFGQAEYRKYQNDSFDPQDLYYVAASGVWAIAPKQFYWTLGDLLRQVLKDPTAPDTPTNRITLNVFNTGPDALIRVNPSNTLALGLRYGNDTYSDHSADDYRYGGYGRWLYNIGTRATLSGNVEATVVRYLPPPAPATYLRNDYRISNYYFGLTTRSPTLVGSLDLGWTNLNELPGNVSAGDKPLVGHPLLRLTMTRQITRDESGGIAARAEYTDAATSLLARQTELGVQNPGGIGYLAEAPVADPYFETRGELFFVSKGASVIWDTRAVARQLEYQYRTDLDRSELLGRVGATYVWSPIMSASLYGEYMQTAYDTTDRTDRDTTFTLRLVRRLTRSFSFAIEGGQDVRRSTDPAAEYVNYRGLVSLLYSTGPLYVPDKKM